LPPSRPRPALRECGSRAGRDEFQEQPLGGLEVGDVVRSRRKERGDLGRRQALREVLEQRLRRLGRLPPRERRIEVRNEDVVGEQRLPAAGDEPLAVALEYDRRRGVPDGAVGGRRLALQLRRSARGRSRLCLVALVRRSHVGIVEPVDDCVRVEPGGGECGADQLVVVEQEGRREVREVKCAHDVPLGAGLEQPRGDHGATAATRARGTRLRRERERHAVALSERSWRAAFAAPLKSRAAVSLTASRRPIITRRHRSGRRTTTRARAGRIAE
jgi:hypothetical protein